MLAMGMLQAGADGPQHGHGDRLSICAKPTRRQEVLEVALRQRHGEP
jgi:hypothetical protein